MQRAATLASGLWMAFDTLPTGPLSALAVHLSGRLDEIVGGEPSVRRAGQG